LLSGRPVDKLDNFDIFLDIPTLQRSRMNKFIDVLPFWLVLGAVIFLASASARAGNARVYTFVLIDSSLQTCENFEIKLLEQGKITANGSGQIPKLFCDDSEQSDTSTITQKD